MVHDPAAAPSVFISYAHADEPLARDLADALRGHGLGVWIDQSELRIGDSLIQRLAEAIAEGDFVVALVSDASRESRWCKQELAWAASKGIREKRVTVLPLQVGNAEMPSTLADRVWADVTLESVDEIAGRIARDIARHQTDSPVALPRTMPSAARSALIEHPESGHPMLDAVGERAVEVIAEWRRQRNHGGLGVDLQERQARLQLALQRVPEGLRPALPMSAWLGHAEWNEYFRVAIPEEAQADLLAELEAAHALVDRSEDAGAGRWRIVRTYGEVHAGSRDARVLLWEIDRGGDTRRVEVAISFTALASEGLPPEVENAQRTGGRSAVLLVLGLDDPPRTISVSTAGIRWEPTS